MKPDWDKLMTAFKGSETTLIADVDCTAGGKDLCQAHGVNGYPSLKHGDPNSMEDYQGGRDFKSLKKFADDLKPKCSPFNLDLCEGEEKTKIAELLDMSVSKLDEQIAEKEKEVETAEATFKTELDKLQKNYEKLNKEKEDTIAKVKSSGLGLMKSVKAKLAKGSKAARDDL